MMGENEHHIKPSTSRSQFQGLMHLADHILSTNTDINISRQVPIFSPLFSWTRLEKVFTTSLNRHEHTNIQTTGNNKNKTGDVTHSATTIILRVVPGTVVGITWTLQKKFLVQLPIFRFPHSYFINPLAPQLDT